MADDGARGQTATRSCIYHGTVWHQRYKVDHTSSDRASHGFRVPMPWVCLDLDELAAGGAAVPPWLLCVDGSRWAPLAFRAEDHLRSFPPPTDVPPGETPAGTLARRVRELIAIRAPGGECPRGRLLLLTHLRHWGYTFNPVAIYYLVDGSTSPPTLTATALETSNTPWNEEHVYVVAGPEVSGKFPLDKRFHVSPFNPMHQRMAWRLKIPGDELHMVVDLVEPFEGQDLPDAALGCPAATEGAGRIFNAGVAMTNRRPLTVGTALWLLCTHPFLPHMLQWRIHLQAMHLLRKGVKFWPHPQGTKTAASRVVEALVKKGPYGAAAASGAWGAALAAGLVAPPVLYGQASVDLCIALVLCAAWIALSALAVAKVRSLTKPKPAKGHKAK